MLVVWVMLMGDRDADGRANAQSMVWGSGCFSFYILAVYVFPPLIVLPGPDLVSVSVFAPRRTKNSPL